MEKVIRDGKLMIQIFEYEDRELFCERYARREPNFKALYSIFTEGMKVYIISKIYWRIGLTVGYASVIDGALLSKKEGILRKIFEIPSQYEGMFINDFHIKKEFRRKGLGRKLAGYVLEDARKYMLLPLDDGKLFWSKMGFVYDRKEHLMMLDKRKIGEIIV